jgi:hypothetical protein
MSQGFFGYGHYTLKGAAHRYGVHYCVIRGLARKLNLAQERVGQTRVFAPEEMGTLEVGLRALGYPIPGPSFPSTVESLTTTTMT